jgi:hypothetical protein
MITVYGFRNESFWLGVDPGEPALESVKGQEKIDTQRASTADLGSFSVAKVLAVDFLFFISQVITLPGGCCRQ